MRTEDYKRTKTTCRKTRIARLLCGFLPREKIMINWNTEEVEKQFPRLSKLDCFRIANYISQAYAEGVEAGRNQEWWREQDEYWEEAGKL
jgi:hypothetical protein